MTSGSDQSDLRRASDVERQATAELMGQALGEGRLEAPEADERLGAGWSCRTRGELAALVGDLPVPATPPLPQRSGGRDRRHAIAVLGKVERFGKWLMPPRFHITSVLGAATIDLREAQFQSRDVVLDVVAVLAGV